MVTDEGPGGAPFRAHTELLQAFLARREAIVRRIEGVLNAQRKPPKYLQDRRTLSRDFEDCFFESQAISADLARLRGRLEAAHWASGFRPRAVAGIHNDLIHPAEMAVRAFYCWQQTRWPGRNGRRRYAQTLFDVYMLRQLELLAMRIWDAGPSGAEGRLAELQTLLDALVGTTPADQPVLLRDARWLIPLALSPTTDELAAYFDVARNVAGSLRADERIEICKAAVQMIGGHLRSQIRHYCLTDGVPVDAKSVVLRTRTSNALDLALLIQYLVPLLEAYRRAWLSGDDERRSVLASAICQGISADPELFVNRLDLLGPYSMIDYLFISTDTAGWAGYTPAGDRHVQSLRDYEALIARSSAQLHEDCLQFRPNDGAYSPYGAIFGTPSNLTEHMALKALDRDAETRFGIEDVFTDGRADKLDWVNGWRRLPHIGQEVQRLHEFPQRFAAEMFERIEQALRRHVAGGHAGVVGRSGRLCAGESTDGQVDAMPELAPGFVVSSDREVVAAGHAEPCEQGRLLRDRLEGHFLVSYETAGGWVAIRKDTITEVLGAGVDARLDGVPSAPARVLELMFPARADRPARSH